MRPSFGGRRGETGPAHSERWSARCWQRQSEPEMISTWLERHRHLTDDGKVDGKTKIKKFV